MNILIAFILILFNASSFAVIKHLPQSRDYVTNVDTGYTQYGTPSIFLSSKYVLTYDDGPHITYTPAILNLLKKHKVSATFFIVTERLNPKTIPIALRAIKEGHIVASHHHSHDHNNHVDSKTFKSKLKKSIKEIIKLYKLAKVPLKNLYYRFPYAEYGRHDSYHHMNIIREVSHELFKNNCIRFVFWDHDSSDWMSALSSTDVFNNLKSFQLGGEYLTYKVLRNNGRTSIIKKVIPQYANTEGGVILQHDIQEKTIEATRLFLEYSENNLIDIIPLKSTSEYTHFPKACVSSFNQ